MATAAGNDDAFDRGLTTQAGLALPPVNPVLQLKEAFLAVSVDVVRDGRSAQGDSLSKDPLNRFVQFAEIVARKACGPTPRTDASTK